MYNEHVHAPEPRHPALVLLATILASSLAFVDGSVVNVALPAVGRGLSADPDGLQWLVNAYLLPLSALLLLGGAAGDYFGRRRLLIAGTMIFAVASIVCSMAPGMAPLVAGRLLQGTGAALLMPNSLAILGQTFTGAAKGRAIGIWAAVGAAMAAIGPVLGGWLIDVVGWRAIFWINVPLAVGAIAVAWRGVPRDVGLRGERLDWVGGLLATAALATLTWALTLGSGRSGWSRNAIAAAVLAASLGAAFVEVERRHGERAMLPLSLFTAAGFVGLSLLTLLLYGAMGEMFVLLPYVLIEGAGYSATSAGSALLPLPILLAITSPLFGALAGRIGPRWPLTVGPLVVAAGFLLALRVDGTAPYAGQVLPLMLVVAFGMSLAVAPLTTAVLSSVDARHTGSASGFNSAAARTGGLVATALLGSVLAARGPALIAAFHTSMLVGALACIAASACAFRGVDRK